MKVAALVLVGIIACTHAWKRFHPKDELDPIDEVKKDNKLLDNLSKMEKNIHSLSDQLKEKISEDTKTLKKQREHDERIKASKREILRKEKQQQELAEKRGLHARSEKVGPEVETVKKDPKQHDLFNGLYDIKDKLLQLKDSLMELKAKKDDQKPIKAFGKKQSREIAHGKENSKSAVGPEHEFIERKDDKTTLMTLEDQLEQLHDGKDKVKKDSHMRKQEIYHEHKKRKVKDTKQHAIAKDSSINKVSPDFNEKQKDVATIASLEDQLDQLDEVQTDFPSAPVKQDERFTDDLNDLEKQVEMHTEKKRELMVKKLQFIKRQLQTLKDDVLKEQKKKMKNFELERLKNDVMQVKKSLKALKADIGN